MMPRKFFHLAFILFIVTALSGIWMRAIPFVSNPLLNYENILHGHSHIAILGWAFFGLFIVFLAILWPNLKEKKHAIALTISIFSVSIVMFFAFLYEGYGTLSIIMSTLHIFVEYWAVYFIYKQLKAQEHLPKVGRLFIKGSLITLVISTIGPFALGYLGATGLRDTDFFDMSIYFFLHFQYNGFLFLFLIGLFIFILHDKKLKLSNTLMNYGFWIYFIALFPWFISAILWADLGNLARIIANIGSVGQFAGVLVIILAIKQVRQSIKNTFSKLTFVSIISTLFLLVVKSMMEIGLIVPSLSELVFTTRSVIIGYLHLTLLGFVSVFILTLFQMIGVIDSTRNSVMIGTLIFACGFLINELYLFMMGLTSWIHIFSLPYYSETLLVTSILLAIGIGMLWVSTANQKTIFNDYKKTETS